jgi:hypothetical protein
LLKRFDFALAQKYIGMLPTGWCDLLLVNRHGAFPSLWEQEPKVALVPQREQPENQKGPLLIPHQRRNTFGGNRIGNANRPVTNSDIASNID